MKGTGRGSKAEGVGVHEVVRTPASIRQEAVEQGRISDIAVQHLTPKLE